MHIYNSNAFIPRSRKQAHRYAQTQKHTRPHSHTDPDPHSHSHRHRNTPTRTCLPSRDGCGSPHFIHAGRSSSLETHLVHVIAFPPSAPLQSRAYFNGSNSRYVYIPCQPTLCRQAVALIMLVHLMMGMLAMVWYDDDDMI